MEAVCVFDHFFNNPPQMNNEYLGSFMYNGVGFTFSPEMFGPEIGEDFSHFYPDDFDPEEAIIIHEVPNKPGQSVGNDDKTDSILYPAETFQLSGETPSEDTLNSNSGVTGCPVYFSIVLIILLITGLVAGFLAYAETVIRSKKYLHSHNILHILVSSLCVLLPIPFAAVSRISGEWIFGDAWFKVLAVVGSGAQTACAFQLAYIVLIRCREVINRREVATSVWNKIICFVLWLIAMAFAWPCAVYGSILADLIKGQRISESRSFGASLYIKVNVAVSYIFPSLVVFLCLFTTFMHKPNREDEKKKKIPLRLMRSLKEAASLFAMYFICWLPYRAWRIATLTLLAVTGCGVPSDIFLFIGMTFCTLMPILHYALAVNRDDSEKDIEISTTGEDPTQTSGSYNNAVNDSKEDAV